MTYKSGDMQKKTPFKFYICFGLLVLVSLPALIAQVPYSCFDSEKCCPVRENQVCSGHGVCRPRDSVFSTFSFCPSSIVEEWNSLCVCEENWFGVDCSECSPGFSGQNCEDPVVVQRKNYLDLTSSEQAYWIEANVRMKKYIDPNFQPFVRSSSNTLVSVYDTLVYLHQLSIIQTKDTYCGEPGKCNYAHGGSGFPTWHRYFMWRYEQLLHRFGFPKHLGSPYWDWTDEITRDWPFNGIFGQAVGNVTSGPFGNWELAAMEWLGPESNDPCPNAVSPSQTVLWRDK